MLYDWQGMWELQRQCRVHNQSHDGQLTVTTSHVHWGYVAEQSVVLNCFLVSSG